MEQGQIEEALATYRTAANITPGCILRLQHAGTLSFYAGDAATAVQMLERTWTIGSKSRLFDVLSMMLLAFLRFDARDTKALSHSCDVLNRFTGNYPQSVRLKRMAQYGFILSCLLDGQVAHGVLLCREALAEVHHPDFDMEAATNMMSLWARLDQYGVEPPEYATVVKQLSRRFSVSKAATEVLIAAARRDEAAAGWVRESHAEILHLAEAAMNQALKGQPRAAVEALLSHGEETGNAKLIEMAGAVARRHQDRIENIEGLLANAATLAHRYCNPSSHIAGVRRSNRSAGGLVLRR
jgi:hypothetical protein